MRIAVCIKQVPATTLVNIDPQTGTLLRDGAQAKINPYDLFALETAIRLKETHGAQVCALTMGPGQARRVLREAYRMDVDRAVLVSDRAFAGADVLATARTLAMAIRSLGRTDLILCGKQTTDGDTAQVGPAIAELLGIPHAAWVSKIISAEETGIRVLQELDDEHTAQLFLPFPCLITTEKDIVDVRLPSYQKMLKNQDKPIEELGLKDMPDQNPMHYGLFGSPTQVRRIFPPEGKSGQVLVDGSAPDVGERLVMLLHSTHVL